MPEALAPSDSREATRPQVSDSSGSSSSAARTPASSAGGDAGGGAKVLDLRDFVDDGDGVYGFLPAAGSPWWTCSGSGFLDKWTA